MERTATVTLLEFLDALGNWLNEHAHNREKCGELLVLLLEESKKTTHEGNPFERLAKQIETDASRRSESPGYFIRRVFDTDHPQMVIASLRDMHAMT